MATDEQDTQPEAADVEGLRDAIAQLRADTAAALEQQSQQTNENFARYANFAGLVGARIDHLEQFALETARYLIRARIKVPGLGERPLVEDSQREFLNEWGKRCSELREAAQHGEPDSAAE